MRKSYGSLGEGVKTPLDEDGEVKQFDVSGLGESSLDFGFELSECFGFHLLLAAIAHYNVFVAEVDLFVEED